jgi:hypothetical protein
VIEKLQYMIETLLGAKTIETDWENEICGVWGYGLGVGDNIWCGGHFSFLMYFWRRLIPISALGRRVVPVAQNRDLVYGEGRRVNRE